MKHLSGFLHKLTAVAAVAVALSSCNRAEYAMLPKTSSAYHGTQRAVVVTPAPATETAVAPVTTEAVAAAPAVVAAPAAPVAAAASITAKAEAPVPAPIKAAKLNFAQKAVVAKVTKQLNKLAAKAQVNKKSEVAAKEDANALSRNIKLGILLLIIGILLGIFGGVIGVLGYILSVIGVVLIILGLLDEV